MDIINEPSLDPGHGDKNILDDPAPAQREDMPKCPHKAKS